MKPFGRLPRSPSLQALPQTPAIKQITIPLADGVKGNLQTVQVMQRVARLRASDPFVREAASLIVQGAPSHDYIEEARLIGEWVQGNVRYVRDVADEEQLFDPRTLLDQATRGEARGDCDDMSLLVATLLLSIGFTDVRFRCARYDAVSGPYAHIYVVVYDTDASGKAYRLAIDAIVKDRAIGYEVPQRSGDEYPV